MNSSFSAPKKSSNELGFGKNAPANEAALGCSKA